MSNYESVREFHERFGVPVAETPTELAETEFKYRFNFLDEELVELHEAWMNGDLVKQADALIDLVYVALGTALMMGLPWEDLFAIVHRANMQKRRVAVGEPGSRHAFDVRKPDGWVGPEDAMRIVLQANGARL